VKGVVFKQPKDCVLWIIILLLSFLSLNLREESLNLGKEKQGRSISLSFIPYVTHSITPPWVLGFALRL
jgi:hypothetical protein